jgi:hypothetical protein
VEGGRLIERVDDVRPKKRAAILDIQLKYALAS